MIDARVPFTYLLSAEHAEKAEDAIAATEIFSQFVLGSSILPPQAKAELLQCKYLYLDPHHPSVTASEIRDQHAQTTWTVGLKNTPWTPIETKGSYLQFMVPRLVSRAAQIQSERKFGSAPFSISSTWIASQLARFDFEKQTSVIPDREKKKTVAALTAYAQAINGDPVQTPGERNYLRHIREKLATMPEYIDQLPEEAGLAYLAALQVEED